MRGRKGSTDQEVILGSLSDPEQFALLFDRHAAVVKRYVTARVRRDDVDDVVSETFVTAFRIRSRYQEAFEDARPWLLGIATNIIRHHHRSEGRRLARLRKTADPSEPQVDPSDIIIAAEDDAIDHDRVGRALAQLEERYQEVVLLVAGFGLTYDEVARALDVPVGTVRSRLSRGRQQLRELIEADGQPKSDVRPVMQSTEGRHE